MTLKNLNWRVEREHRYVLFLLLLVLCFFLISCGSRPLQSDKVLSDRSWPVRQHEIKDVPYVKQTTNHCGPAALSMVMQYWGDSADMSDLVTKTYTAQSRGSYQADMISAARRRGYMAVPIEGMHALIAEVKAGHPVIVFENLGLSWYPQWHYAVVYGFDLNRQRLLMHSGPKQAMTENIADFERSWMLGNYWGLVVLRPGELAVTGSEFQNSTAAAALENLRFYEAAERSYEAVLQRWPRSLVALMGMGNLMYRQGRLSRALDYFEEAAYVHPGSVAAQHNYVVLEQALRSK